MTEEAHFCDYCSCRALEGLSPEADKFWCGRCEPGLAAVLARSPNEELREHLEALLSARDYFLYVVDLRDHKPKLISFDNPAQLEMLITLLVAIVGSDKSSPQTSPR
jgi:hypothetical protein